MKGKGANARCHTGLLGHELEIVHGQPTTFDRACERADRERLCQPHDKPGFVSHASGKYRLVHKAAPQVTVEALVIAVRTGALDALDKPINKVRFSELSPRQRKELRMRLKQIAMA